jgi:hypothetical protein
MTDKEPAGFSFILSGICGDEGTVGAPGEWLAGNVRVRLSIFADRFMRVRVVDPANPKNVVSDDLNPEERG